MPRPLRASARPKLGQNFLADPRAALRIVNALGDISAATVVEIGSGRGALTEVLATRARHLIAIELDRVLGAQLRMRYARQPNIEIVEGDVLDIDFHSLMRRTRRTSGDTKPQSTERALVVGNLPYYITSPILMHLFAHHDVIDKIVIMVQREVAERIAAKPGSRAYGLLSATAQLYARVAKLFTLPPGAFSPPPKVHSTVLRLTIEPRQLGVPAAELLEFLKLSFGQKRKTLLNNLRTHYEEEQVRRALRAASIRPDARAEAIPLEKAATVLKQLRA
jgi:16S rRNA (adenine1518-N6/adenine1519-N6)-dimethyltransferase